MSKISKILITIVLMFAFLGSGTFVFAIEDNSAIKIEEPKKTIVDKIDFDSVLKKAEEHSYDIQIADYNVLISKQDIRAARSEYFPKLNFVAGLEYTKNFRDAQDTTVMTIGEAFINPYTRFQSIMGITVAYNVFDFGVRGGNVKIAKTDVELRELETKETRQELNLTLLDSYTKILVTSKQIDINKEILKLAEENLEYKERLFKAKEISKTELNDAKVEVSTVKNRINELNSIRQESVNWLSFYTGDEYDAQNLKAEELKQTNFDVNSFQDYTKSITWKIHEKNIKKKELEVKVAQRTNYPKVNAYGRYYLYGSDHSNFGKAFDIEPSNFSVGASVYVPLFDGMKNRSNIQRKKLELKQLMVERDKAIAQLMTRLANMRSNLIWLDKQVSENVYTLDELKDKEKSMNKLASKKLVSPIEKNEAKIELLNEQIEFFKNSITQVAITKGIEILSEEN